MFALNLLRVPLARLVLSCIQMTGVGTIIIRVISRDSKRLQKRFQLQKDVVLTTPKDVSQHFPRQVIDGMPQPTRFGLAADKTSHFIDFCIVDAIENDVQPTRVHQPQEGLVDEL